MIIKTQEESLAVPCPNGGFISYRYLLDSDNMGFTLTKTVIPVNGVQHWHYENHFEACICIDGFGCITNKETGEKHFIKAGTMYALNNNDDHEFEAFEEVTLICVFNPPLKGKEVHNKDGVYE